MEYGAQVVTEDGFVGYVLGWHPAPEGAPHATDVRVFRFDSSGQPNEMVGSLNGWTPTGKSADRSVLAHMKAWRAEQDLLDTYAAAETCQGCGGHPGMTDDTTRCVCDDR